jgi:hypothetical protein
MSTQQHGAAAQAVIWKPNEHADEYMVFVDDPKEVSILVPFMSTRTVAHATQYEAWKEDKSIALSRFLGQFSIVSRLRASA